MCGGLHRQIDFPGPVSLDVGLAEEVPGRSKLQAQAPI